MKITWFGGHALRVQASGQIATFFADSADEGFDRKELASGADRVVEGPVIELPAYLAASFERPAPRRLIEELDEEADGLSFTIARLGEADIVVQGEQEIPLVILAVGEGDVADAPGDWPHHVRDCAILLFRVDAAILRLVKQLARSGRVRVFLVAVPGLSESDWADLARSGEGVPMQVLEPSLGLEL